MKIKVARFSAHDIHVPVCNAVDVRRFGLMPQHRYSFHTVWFWEHRSLWAVTTSTTITCSSMLQTSHAYYSATGV